MSNLVLDLLDTFLSSLVLALLARRSSDSNCAAICVPMDVGVSSMDMSTRPKMTSEMRKQGRKVGYTQQSI